MKIFSLLLLMVAPVSAGQFGTNFLSQYRVSGTHFNEGTGTTSHSIGSSASDWTALTGWTDGKFGPGMLMINTSAPLSNIVVTASEGGLWVHAWIKNTSAINTVVWFSYTSPTSCCFFSLKDVNSSNLPGFGCYIGGWSNFPDIGNFAITDGRWHMVDVYRIDPVSTQPQTWTMYVDGVKNKTKTNNSLIIFNGTTTSMSLSGERCGGAGTTSIVGTVDDFQIFKFPAPGSHSQIGALIKKMYTAGIGSHSND